MNRSVEKGRELDDAEARQVVQALVKQRRDSIEQFLKGGRQDLVDKETAEIAVLESYLPPAADPAVGRSGGRRGDRRDRRDIAERHGPRDEGGDGAGSPARPSTARSSTSSCGRNSPAPVAAWRGSGRHHLPARTLHQPPPPDRIARSAGLAGAATLASRLLGLAREQVLAALFGAGNEMDAYLVAFRIPNLVRDLFAEGAMSAAFVPTFTRHLAHARQATMRGAWATTCSTRCCSSPESWWRSASSSRARSSRVRGRLRRRARQAGADHRSSRGSCCRF